MSLQIYNNKWGTEALGKTAFYGTSWKKHVFNLSCSRPAWVPAGVEEEFSTNIFTAPSQEFLRHTLHSIIIVNLTRQIEQVGIWGEWKSFWLVLTFFISKCNYQPNYSQCLALRVAHAQQTMYFCESLKFKINMKSTTWLSFSVA